QEAGATCLTIRGLPLLWPQDQQANERHLCAKPSFFSSLLSRSARPPPSPTSIRSPTPPRAAVPATPSAPTSLAKPTPSARRGTWLVRLPPNRTSPTA